MCARIRLWLPLRYALAAGLRRVIPATSEILDLNLTHPPVPSDVLTRRTERALSSESDGYLLILARSERQSLRELLTAEADSDSVISDDVDVEMCV